MSKVDFGEAIKVLKKGRRVARSGWNGKGMWLVLIEPKPRGKAGGTNVTVRLPVGPVQLHAVGDVVLGDWLTGSDKPVSTYKLLPWIGMKTVDDGFVPWLASQTDMLAEDWEVLEEETS